MNQALCLVERVERMDLVGLPTSRARVLATLRVGRAAASRLLLLVATLVSGSAAGSSAGGAASAPAARVLRRAPGPGAARRGAPTAAGARDGRLVVPAVVARRRVALATVTGACAAASPLCSAPAVSAGAA